MYPYIHIGSFQLGTFGLLLWLAAVCGTIVLHRNFIRNGVDADALNVVALVTLSGIIGAKLWHELQNPAELALAWHQIWLPGWSHIGQVLMGFLHWFQTGFAWFGGMLAGVAMLMWQGRLARFKGPEEGTQGERVGAWRMLDLATPAAAIGYGVGRIGCLTSGDGDYGINTTLPWGVHMAKDALVPPNPPDALVQPTPVYEFLFAVLICWLLWELGKRHKPIAWLTGVYLMLSGFGRFLGGVRANQIRSCTLGHTMSNAQVAALGSVVCGAVVLVWAIRASAGSIDPAAVLNPPLSLSAERG